MKAVFDTRAGSGYDDDVTRRYHFPSRYLDAATQAVGDWIVYREPVRGKGKPGYISVARLDRIEPDPVLRGHSYAWVSDYLPFDVVVPIRHSEGYYEAALNSVGAPSLIGRSLQGRSVRVIPDEDFGAIVRAGLGVTLDPANAVRLELDPVHIGGETLALIEAPAVEQERRVVQMLMNRKIRDAAFRRAVVDAYDNRCAVTGLRIVNGGGKAEVQAAHIWSVADGGPDTVQNGLALSATAHWCFDRHLISVTEDYRLLVSHNKVPAELRGLFARQLDGIHRPKDPRLWPHPAYLQRHRELFADDRESK